MMVFMAAKCLKAGEFITTLILECYISKYKNSPSSVFDQHFSRKQKLGFLIVGKLAQSPFSESVA